VAKTRKGPRGASMLLIAEAVLAIVLAGQAAYVFACWMTN
jgi:hypothetical protein